MCHTVIWDVQYGNYALNTEYAYNTRGGRRRPEKGVLSKCELSMGAKINKRGAKKVEN